MMMNWAYISMSMPMSIDIACKQAYCYQ